MLEVTTLGRLSIQRDSGEESLSFAGHSGTVLAVAFSPNGALLATGGHDLPRLWDLATGQELDTFPGHTGMVSLTDLASGQTTEIATTNSTYLGFVHVGDGMFSPDGSTLVYTAGYDPLGNAAFALFQVDFATGMQRELLAPQPTRYKVVRFEDDGSLLLTVVGPWEETGTFRLHPDGTLEHLSDSTVVGISQ
ncbi:WD40 repeat domain-containing protein [Chloroflexota bacterium]